MNTLPFELRIQAAKDLANACVARALSGPFGRPWGPERTSHREVSNAAFHNINEARDYLATVKRSLPDFGRDATDDATFKAMEEAFLAADTYVWAQVGLAEHIGSGRKIEARLDMTSHVFIAP
jgi:hypothetical protein